MCLCEYSPVATFINTFIKRSPARVRARALARASNLCTNTLDLYSRLCVARVASLHAAAQTHARAHTHRAERAGAYNASPKMLRCSLVYPPAPRLQTQSAFGIAIWRTQISAEFSNSAEHVRTRARTRVPMGIPHGCKGFGFFDLVCSCAGDFLYESHHACGDM